MATESAREALGLWLPYWSVLPFVLMLLAIALVPLQWPHFWESNRNKGLVSAALGLPVALLVGANDPHLLVHTCHEYVAFIVLLGALFVISGGIVLRGDLLATPAVNTGFLAVGAVLANLIGTTGASMLLIRPLLQTNLPERRHVIHIPIFFIFVVSNTAGLLTPLGDPPLFLGFLRGVPFFWTLRLLPQWIFTASVLLTLFYVIDRRAVRLESPDEPAADLAELRPLTLAGRINILYLLGVVAVVLASPSLPDGPAADLGPIAAMTILAGLSLATTPRPLREENRFGFGPIVEVAVLFAGIFATMIPALVVLEQNGAALGVDVPWKFFWATGSLSSFLDNAPTYLTFTSLAQGLGPGSASALHLDGGPVAESLLAAIACGSVFMGANSYIGNGPNFMVKAIAEEQGVPMPTFFGYMAWSCGILVPLFVVVTLLFFR